jgi:hypothetical protein
LAIHFTVLSPLPAIPTLLLRGPHTYQALAHDMYFAEHQKTLVHYYSSALGLWHECGCGEGSLKHRCSGRTDHPIPYQSPPATAFTFYAQPTAYFFLCGLVMSYKCHNQVCSQATSPGQGSSAATVLSSFRYRDRHRI